MKKTIIISLIVLVIMAVGFSIQGFAKDKERYVFVSIVATHTYWIDAKEGGRAAAEQLGVKFEYTGPAGADVAAQATTMEQIIATRPAGIITTGHSPEAISPVIKKAVDSGIPVMTVDTDAPNSERYTYIGTNNYNAGQFMADLVVDILGGKGKVGISTLPGQFNLEERIRGIKDVFAKYPDLQIVATADNHADDSLTANAVSAMIQANPDLDMIVNINATGAGVVSALKQTQKVGKIHAVVFDITEPILTGVKDGILDATIAQKTFMFTYLAVNLLYDYNHGKMDNMVGVDKGVNPLPEKIDTGVVAVTKDNVDAYFRK